MVNFSITPPWSLMRRCNLSDAGAVLAYYGDGAYKEDGSNGQVMVEIPTFYYKVALTATGYQWYVSAVPMPGYKVHPAFVRNGVTQSKLYVGAYEACAYDVTAAAIQSSTWTITAGCSTSGTITLVFDGNITVVVPVTAGQTAAQVADAIAAAITAYASWAKYGESVAVTHTAGQTSLTLTWNAAGLKTAATFSPASTGVTYSNVTNTTGAGGYCQNDPAGLDFTVGTGDKLASIAGVKPVSGWHNTLSIVNARKLAQNRGTNWQLADFLSMSAVQLLYLIEYGTFNSQTAIGQGVVNVTDDTSTNMAVLTGQTASLGNASGSATGQTHYQTGQSANSISYRGIENLWGNIYAWIDGINIKADHMPWVADHGFASDKFSAPYVDTGLVLPGANGYVSDLALNAAMDYGFLPSAVAGSSSTKLCDYYYQAAGNMAARLSGYWADSLYAGAFYWSLNYSSSNASRFIGARLLYVGGSS